MTNMETVEIDFLVNLVIDFEKTTDVDIIKHSLETTLRNNSITKSDINMVLRKRALASMSNTLSLQSHFKEQNYD